MNISDGSSSFRVQSPELDADPTGTASQEHPKESQKNQLETDGSCSHIMEDVCVTKKDKNQNGWQVRRYSPMQPYTSSAILHNSTGGPPLIDKATINVCLDHYDNFKTDLQMPRNLMYFWNRLET